MSVKSTTAGQCLADTHINTGEMLRYVDINDSIALLSGPINVMLYAISLAKSANNITAMQFSDVPAMYCASLTSLIQDEAHP